MIPSASTIGQTIKNGLETYEVLEQLRSGEKSTLFRVLCRSGRLRNRHLALKKILITPSSTSSTSANPHLTPTTPLHQALHHPNIVSLLSAFSTAKETFHVLELCSVGSLSHFLRARPLQILQEPELRVVTKSIVDALAYLRKELVVHGNINPSNILLTADYGVKLSNFKYAIRLTGENYTTSAPSCTSSSAAPEITSGGAHGFAADIWSLGCVIVYCLTGKPINTKSMFRNRKDVTQPAFDLPGDLSTDVKELISCILQFIPENRIDLPDILTHSFLANSLPVASLRTTSATSNTSYQTPFIHPHRNDDRILPKLPPFKTNRATRQASRHVSDQSSQRTRHKLVLGDIGNLNLRSMLCDELATVKGSDVAGPTRRVVSDPALLRMDAYATGVLDSPQGLHTRFNRTAPPPKIKRDLALGSPTMPSVPLFESETVTQVPFLPHVGRTMKVENLQNLKRLVDEQNLETKSPNSYGKLPVGTERPFPLNTATMTCQTHKTTYGQITILPSRSLLVDFRESQRRKGLKGDEVFIVEPEGHEISVYNAPHLSSPCCLVEPTQTFSIQNLPPNYWKQYNDAARLIDQIKQRTPKFVFYSGVAKCTLMANTPRGEIELLFNTLASIPTKAQLDNEPSLRIRFSRQSQSFELARHLSDSRGEEWTKKVIRSTPEPPYVSSSDWRTLEQAEKDAWRHLTRFVQMCDVVERLMDDIPVAPSSPVIATDQDKELTILAERPKANSSEIQAAITPTVTSSFSLLKFAPRPSKLTSTSHSTPDLTNDTHVPQESSTPRDEITAKRIISNVNSGRHDVDLNETTRAQRAMQTRFIPFVGWCIRYASRFSQGGRYRMMFLDGVALDIDVDEDWVEFKSQSGETTTYNIRDVGSKRKIGDRLKVFEEFVSMFDDSQQE